MKKINYPATHTQENSKLAWCYQGRRKLIEEHNVFGIKLKTGEITRQEFDDFINTVYIPKQRRLIMPSIHTFDMVARFNPKWFPTIEQNLEMIDGVWQVKYPVSLNENNEGSKLSCLASFKETLQQGGYKDTPQWAAVELEETAVIVLAEQSEFHNVDIERDIVER